MPLSACVISIYFKMGELDQATIKARSEGKSNTLNSYGLDKQDVMCEVMSCRAAGSGFC